MELSPADVRTLFEKACILEALAEKEGCTTRTRDAGPNKTMTIPLTLSQPVLTGSTTVYIQISSISATHGPKSAGGDWTGAVNRKLVFKPGVVLRAISISVASDRNDELDETVSVQIVGIVGDGVTAVFAGPHLTGTGTILTDE